MMSQMRRRIDLKRRQWEEDLQWRQRNFVFPDTVRNEGIFLRTLVGRKTPLSGVQRFGMVLLAILFLLGGCFSLAGSIATFLNPHKDSAFGGWLALVVGGGVSLFFCLLGALMLFRALLRPSSPSPAKSPTFPKHQGRIRPRRF